MSNNVELRSYQTKSIIDVCEAWKNHRRVILQLPTGAGKTLIATKLITSLLLVNSQARIRFIVHRKELVRQTSKFFTEQDISHSFIAAGHDYDPDANIYVCMVQTLAARKIDLPTFDLTIIDEAHHATSKSYGEVVNGHGKVLGLTATPRRLDGKPLKDSFDYLVQGPSILELIEQGYLAIPEIAVPPKTANLIDVGRQQWDTTAGDYNKKQVNEFFSTNANVIYGDVITHYKKLIVDKPTMVFCSSVHQVYEIVQLFEENGITSAGIDGSMLDEERIDVVNRFKTGQIKCLMSCDLISEGFDLPDAYAAIMLRPTKSLTVFLQQAGRVLRMKDNKHTCLIVDHVNNCEYFGYPWLPRYWSLDGYNKRIRHDSLTGAKLKLCLRCGNYIRQGCMICPICGKVLKVKNKAIKTILEQLTVITIESAKDLIDKAINKILDREKRKMLKTKEDFLKFAQERNFKNPEAWAEKQVSPEAIAEREADKKTYFEGDRDALIKLGVKQKRPDPIAFADETLAKRGTKRPSAFANMTIEQIEEVLKTDPKYANKFETDQARRNYAKGIKRRELQVIFENGTDIQKAEAQTILDSLGKFQSFEDCVSFAKSGKMLDRDTQAPVVLDDEKAAQFARNYMRKNNIHGVADDFASKDPERVRRAAELTHVTGNIDNYVRTVIEKTA